MEECAQALAYAGPLALIVENGGAVVVPSDPNEPPPDALREGGFTPFVPQGAYYMLAEVPREFANASEAAMTLINEAGVASVPGPSFYASGRGDRLLRFCFAKDFGALEEACKRLSRSAVA